MKRSLNKNDDRPTSTSQLSRTRLLSRLRRRHNHPPRRQPLPSHSPKPTSESESARYPLLVTTLITPATCSELPPPKPPPAPSSTNASASNSFTTSPRMTAPFPSTESSPTPLASPSSPPTPLYTCQHVHGDSVIPIQPARGESASEHLGKCVFGPKFPPDRHTQLTAHSRTQSQISIAKLRQRGRAPKLVTQRRKATPPSD
jgi:hypothetical protein